MISGNRKNEFLREFNALSDVAGPQFSREDRIRTRPRQYQGDDEVDAARAVEKKQEPTPVDCGGG